MADSDILARVEALLQRKPDDIDAYLICSPENRFYLSGFTGSAGCLLIGPQFRVLATDFRYGEQAKRQCPEYTVASGPKLWEQVGRLAREQHWARIAVEAQQMTVSTFQILQKEVAEVRWIPVAGAVESLRQVKGPSELEDLRKAAEIADAALRQIIPWIRAGVAERTLAVELEHAMRQNGAWALSFPTIVASGPRGSLPHGEPTERVLENGDMVTIDFGAVYGMYHSDETVTVPVSAAAGTEQHRAIYDIVYQAQKAGMDLVKPGVLASDIDAACRNVIAQAGYGEFFGHGTGHGVGLEVHEDPYLGPRSGAHDILEAGMVVTVEPGIYLPGVCGVRLEDTLLVTESGSDRLTRWDKRWLARE